MTYRIFIDGAAGTTGLQVNERLAAHPSVTPVTLDDAKRKDAAARREMMAANAITILCLPDAAARESALLAAEVGARVIDASTAHRTAEGWDFGFVELFDGARDAVAGSARISNPGCYSTGFLALARPLVAAGIVAADAGLTVPAVSGYSGGGKGMIGRFEAGEMPPHGAYGLALAQAYFRDGPLCWARPGADLHAVRGELLCRHAGPSAASRSQSEPRRHGNRYP